MDTDSLQVFQVDEGHQEQWDSFVAQCPHFALMQSYQWGEFKENLGWKAIRLTVQQQGHITGVTQLLIKSAPLGLFSVGYVPRGPLVDWQDHVTTSALLGALHSEARRHRAIFVKIEPPLLNSPEAHRQLQQYGFRVSPYCNQPRATITVDLTQDLDDILKPMRKQTRRDIRRAARKGVTVRVGGLEDLTAFCDLMQMTSRRGEFSSRGRDYYQLEWQTFAGNRQAVLFMAFYREHLLAMQMACRFGNQAAAIHGVSSREYAELCPNHLLVWEAIKWSKTLGCETYDLWGIPAEVGQAVYEGRDLPKPGRTDGLWGVYHFKSGFSKNIAYYVGAYDYVYSPLLYAMVTNRLFGASTLDRMAVWMDSLKHI